MSKPKKKKEPDCPECEGVELDVMLFLGVQPDFYVCHKCNGVFHLDTLEQFAKIF